MNKREYSTRNIDRLIKQANSIVANKKVKNSVLAFRVIYEEDSNPAADTYSIIIHENDFLSFATYLDRLEEQMFHERETQTNEEEEDFYDGGGFDEEDFGDYSDDGPVIYNEPSPDDLEYVYSYAKKHFAEDWLNAIEEFVENKLGNLLDTANNKLKYHRIVAIYRKFRYDNTLTIEAQIQRSARTDAEREARTAEKEKINKIMTGIAEKYNFKLTKNWFIGDNYKKWRILT